MFHARRRALRVAMRGRQRAHPLSPVSLAEILANAPGIAYRTFSTFGNRKPEEPYCDAHRSRPRPLCARQPDAAEDLTRPAAHEGDSPAVARAADASPRRAGLRHPISG